MRSPTAEAAFSNRPGVEALSAGTATDAENPVSAELIEWADIIFVMETIHRRRLQKQFSKLLETRKLVVLGIPDKYQYLDPILIKTLLDKVNPFLPSA